MLFNIIEDESICPHVHLFKKGNIKLIKQGALLILTNEVWSFNPL